MTVASRLLVVLFPAIAAGSSCVAAEFREGQDFVRLTAPLAVESANKIEVIEFFSYGGPHCRDFAPFLSEWIKTRPTEVALRRIPVIFLERWLGLAKAYYTLEALGVEEKLSLDVYAAVQGNGLGLLNDKVFADWSAQQGLDRAKVAELYNSDWVRSKVARAKLSAQHYDVQVVPMLVVDGKFVTTLGRGGTPARLLAVLDDLVAKARLERQQVPTSSGNVTLPVH